MAQTISLIGGTGPEGRGLAARFAQAGLEVVIGSRAADRAEEAAREVVALSGGSVRGAANAEAATAGEIIVLTVPYSAQKDTLEALRGEIGNRLVVSAVVPLQFARGRASMMEIEDKSAAEEAQRLLPDARVIGAFHNLSASHLLDFAHPVEGDVIICGDDKEGLEQVMELTNQIKDLRGVNGGPLASCRYVEALTALILNINRAYKAESAIKIIGI